MKAAVYTRYGPPDVVQITEVEKPVPKDNEVLIKVCAAAVNPLDWRLMRGRPYSARILFGLRKPRITRPGRDVAGQVEARRGGQRKLCAGRPPRRAGAAGRLARAKLELQGRGAGGEAAGADGAGLLRRLWTGLGRQAHQRRGRPRRRLPGHPGAVPSGAGEGSRCGTSGKNSLCCAPISSSLRPRSRNSWPPHERTISREGFGHKGSTLCFLCGTVIPNPCLL